MRYFLFAKNLKSLEKKMMSISDIAKIFKGLMENSFQSLSRTSNHARVQEIVRQKVIFSEAKQEAKHIRLNTKPYPLGAVYLILPTLDLLAKLSVEFQCAGAPVARIDNLLFDQILKTQIHYVPELDAFAVSIGHDIMTLTQPFPFTCYHDFRLNVRSSEVIEDLIWLDCVLMPQLNVRLMSDTLVHSRKSYSRQAEQMKKDSVEIMGSLVTHGFCLVFDDFTPESLNDVIFEFVTSLNVVHKWQPSNWEACRATIPVSLERAESHKQEQHAMILHQMVPCLSFPILHFVIVPFLFDRLSALRTKTVYCTLMDRNRDEIFDLKVPSGVNLTKVKLVVKSACLKHNHTLIVLSNNILRYWDGMCGFRYSDEH